MPPNGTPEKGLVEPDVAIRPCPGELMTVRRTGFGPGLYWSCHLRPGRREVVHWFDSPARKLYEISETIVTREVEILGLECFEVWIKERGPDEADWRLPDRFEYFHADGNGTHWVRPRDADRYDLADGIIPDFDDAGAWALQDEAEGVAPHEISSDGPRENNVVEVVDLALGGRTFRCLREIFFEMQRNHAYGGDVFRREDGTTVYYRRLLGEWSEEAMQLAGAPEYDWGERILRVWYSCVLVEEEG